MTLSELIEQHKAGTLQGPPGWEFRVVIDKGAAAFSFHPGWDDEGEELDDDPVYLDVEPRAGYEQLAEALRLLGLPAEHA